MSPTYFRISTVAVYLTLYTVHYVPCMLSIYLYFVCCFFLDDSNRGMLCRKGVYNQSNVLSKRVMHHHVYRYQFAYIIFVWCYANDIYPGKCTERCVHSCIAQPCTYTTHHTSKCRPSRKPDRSYAHTTRKV